MLLFASGLTAFLILGGNRAFNLANLKAHRETLLLYVQDHRASMLIAAMVIYTASIALSLPILHRVLRNPGCHPGLSCH